MNFINRNYVLPLITALFVVVVFFDQNHIPVPMKILVGAPTHVSLSMIIMASMLAGAVLGFAGLLLFGKIKDKFKKNSK